MAETLAHSPATLVTDVIKRTFACDLSVLDKHPGMASLRQHFPAFKAAFPDIRGDLKTVQERIEKGVTVTLVNPQTNRKQDVRPSWGVVADGLRFLMYDQGGGTALA